MILLKKGKTMKLTLKKFIVILLLVSVALQVVGCKQSKKEKTETTEKETKQIEEEEW
jgi:hypothetical protein